MSSGSKKLLLVTIAAALTAALYLAPQKVDKKEESEKSSDAFSFEGLLTEAKGQLKRQEASEINTVEAALAKQPKSITLLDSLGKMWDRLNMPLVSSHYYEQIATADPDEKKWINTAYRYYDAFRMTGDSTLRIYFVDKAISSYKHVLEINPDNLDAKTDLGLCYAEGTSTPMQGILMLREVVEKNPNHEMAQFNLGILSVKSGQYDKAVERFEKVLEINPKSKEARFLLGRTYIAMGKKDLALKNLNELKNSGDPDFDKQVNILISQINNN